MVLTLLAILVAALALLWAAAGFVPRWVPAHSITAIAAVVALLALTALADHAEMKALALPLGPPGTTMRLALDPLGASVLLLLFVAATPCALSGAAPPLALAGMALTVLAADSFTLAVGLLLGGTLWHSYPNRPRRSRLGWECVGCVVCLIAAFALLGHSPDFAALRITPPEGWRANTVLLLVLAGTAMLTRVSTALAAYVLIRLLLDLCGTTQPLWWSVPVLLLGATMVVASALRAALDDTLHAVLSVSPVHQLGLAAIALGVVLLGRAFDLPAVVSLAQAAMWLSLVCHVLSQTLLALCANVVEASAATRQLDRLGGLVHGMPLTALCCVVGLSGISILPPGLGFAAFWLLLQSLLAAARTGGFDLQVLIVLVTASAALSVGIVAVALVRLFGVAFLGRPRTPRCAVAEDPPRPIRLSLATLAVLIGGLGVLPWLALLPASGWVDASTTSILTLRGGADAPGYSPVALAALVTLAGCAAFLASRRVTRQRRREAAWTGGFAPPPAWLPFGDPATQYGPTSFVASLHGLLALLPMPLTRREPLVRWRDRVLHGLTALDERATAVALTVVGLALLAWLVAS